MLRPARFEKLKTENQFGINMVDLMMWLVIAALLLASAIQSIGYYQQAAHLNTLKSDLSGVGSRVMAAASTNGSIDRSAIAAGASESRWSEGVSYAVQSTGTSPIPYLRATHQSVSSVDVIYLFESCGKYGPGINVIPKDGDATCGIAPSGGAGLVIVGASGWSWQDKPDASAVEPGMWRASVISDNGNRMLVGGWHGYLSSSSNSGGFWSPNTPSGTQRNDVWRDLDMSADGQKVIAVGEQAGTDGYGHVYLSNNSGATMSVSSSAGFRNWWTAAMSDDANVMVAAEDTGAVAISRDAGSTWVNVDSLGIQNWYALDTSSDGKHMVAASIGVADNNGYISPTATKAGHLYISHDTGLTWTKLESAGSAGWRGLSVSDDGTKIAASRDAGGVYTSTNGGATWTDHTNTLGLGRYLSLGASNDGQSIVVGRYDDGYVFTSSNGGSSWERQDALGANKWHAVAISGDGSKIIVTKNNADIIVGNHS